MSHSVHAPLTRPLCIVTVSQEIVLITGGGNGIGKLMAKRFSSLGSTIVLWDIDEKATLASME